MNMIYAEINNPNSRLFKATVIVKEKLEKTAIVNIHGNDTNYEVELKYLINWRTIER